MTHAEIGAYDAKTKLPELLRQVQEGKCFTITHRGKPVADLVPSGGEFREAAAQAVEELLRSPRIKDVSGEALTAWKSEGRR